MLFLTKFALEKNQQKVGSIFPTELGEKYSWEMDSNGLILKEIYLLISRHVVNEIWTVQDFKKFRSNLATLRVSDFFEYQNFIKNLLKDPQFLPVLVRELNQTLNLHLFDVREKVIEIDQETGKKIKEYYRVVERNYSVEDIVLVGKKILEKIHTIIHKNCNYLVQYSNESFESLEQIFSYYEELLYGENNELLLQLTEKIIREFDETFSKVTNLEVLAFLMIQRNKMPEKIVDSLRLYYQKTAIACERGKNKAYKQYVTLQIQESQASKAKQRKKSDEQKYGIR